MTFKSSEMLAMKRTMGRWDASAQVLLQSWVGPSKQAGIGDSQQPIRNPQTVQAAAQLREKAVSESPALTIYAFLMPQFPVDISRQSRDALLHTSTYPAKWKLGSLVGSLSRSVEEENKSERPPCFRCRIGGAAAAFLLLCWRLTGWELFPPNVERTLLCFLVWHFY